MKQKLYSHFDKKGFTLIELLVVIGILAVLAAIAIPAVAGLIDRANVAHDNTNANEMTNAIERFASEYELYKQDVAMGIVGSDLDTMQGRVNSVVDGATSRDALAAMEGSVYDKDTFYPLTRDEARQVISTYMKTTSKTFDPKQSDMCYWYSPECGVVVVAEHDSNALARNELIVSGKDAKGNELTADTEWIDLTDGGTGSDVGNGGGSDSGSTENRDWRNPPDQSRRVYTAELNGKVYAFDIYQTFEGEYGWNERNYHFENGMNPQGMDYVVKLHAIDVTISDLSSSEQMSLDEGSLFMQEETGDTYNLIPKFIPYNMSSGNPQKIDTTGLIEYYTLRGINAEGTEWSAINEAEVADYTYDLVSAEYDESTENIIFTFSNGFKVLSPALYSNYGRPYIQIDGRWYRWEYDNTVSDNEFGQTVRSVEPLTPVNESAIESFYYSSKTLATVVEHSLNGTSNGAYGQVSLAYKGTNFKEIGESTTIVLYNVNIVDSSEITQDALDMIGGDINQVSLTNMFGYVKSGHSNSCIDVMTMDGSGVSLRACSSSYDANTDTTTMTFSNCSSNLVTKARITNASNIANAKLELYINGTWVSVYSVSM